MIEPSSLKGRIAIVTGAGQGMGRAVARALAALGATLVVNDLNADTAKATATELSAAGANAIHIQADVTDAAAVRQMVAQAIDRFGGVHVLINNAGIQIRAPLEQFDSDDWWRLIDVNLTGAFLVSKAVVQGMIKRKAGKIINICSIQSELARPTIAPYTAAKGGLRNLTRGMATDWGKYNIQVNGIAPGYFKTELTRPLYQDPKFDAWLRSRVPANRWGEPSELIGAAIFLASKASDYINGHVLYVDGGLMVCV